MKHILTLLVLVCISQLSWAQLIQVSPGGKNNYWHWSPDKKSDKLILDLTNNEKLEIKYSWYDFEERNRKKLVPKIEETIKALKSAIQGFEFNPNLKYHISINYQKPHFSVDYSGKVIIHKKPKLTHKLIIKERDVQKREEHFLVEANKLSQKVRWQNIIEISIKNITLKFFINDITNLDALDTEYSNLFEEVNTYANKTKSYTFFSESYWTKKENKYQSSGFRWKESRPPFWVIGLSPSVGTSLVKGKLSADVGITLAALFNHKHTSGTRIGLHYQLKNFGKNNRVNSSYAGFLDGILDVNMGKNYHHQKWFGLGVGYLIHDNGNIYDSNTGRIYIKFRSSKLWGIKPAYNYSFDTKKGFLSMGLFFSL
ncbi:hypothetical protein EMN47_18105 [Prolixibacteraceae bacterium JC049]|nr:hypothetical protein [Prolixibacteraceae bacterium JC049]